MGIIFIIVLLISASGNKVQQNVQYNWNQRQLAPISALALIKGREYPYKNFDPPLFIREDGAPFISVAVIDNPVWITMAVNNLVSTARYQNLSGITIMTVGTYSNKIASVFKRLGLYTYNANPTIDTFPPDFKPDKHLPHWSWGEIIFMKINLWFEAFRRGIGFCSLDLDVSYNTDVFGTKFERGYPDIIMQGELIPKGSVPNNECKN